VKKVFTIVKADSERVPKKNFRVLGGKPLWKWLVDELSDFHVYVNTDSDTLIKELDKLPHVTPIKRSVEHVEWEKDAQYRGSPVMAMVKEFCEAYLSKRENFALVHVTSPFLKADTLQEAFREYEASDSHSLHSVKAIQDALMFNRSSKIVPSNFDFNKVSRTQDLEPIYQSLGAFFIMNREKLEKENYSRLNESSNLFPLSPLEAIEIDNEDDYLLAQVVARSLMEKK
jgi:CMP-N-acetylneuraminic acid synthetase